MEIVLRNIRNKDLKCLSKIHAKVCKTDEKQTLKVLSHSLKHSIPGSCILAKIDGDICGVVLAEEKTTFSGKGAYISTLFVDAKFQKKGIGKLLLKTCLEKLKKRSIKTVSITVDKTNRPALRIYKNFGFKPFRLLYLLKIDC